MTGAQHDRGLRTGSLVGAVVAAFLASLCCIGPLVLAVLGLGGAGFLLKFEPLRPYFAAATVLLLGAGFYLTYRPRAAPLRADDECGCERPRSTRLARWMLWISAAVVLGFLLFPLIAERVLG